MGTHKQRSLIWLAIAGLAVSFATPSRAKVRSDNSRIISPVSGALIESAPIKLTVSVPNIDETKVRQFGALINGRSVSRLFTQIKGGYSSALIAKRYLRLGKNTITVRYADDTTAAVTFTYSPAPTSITLPGNPEDTPADYLPVHTRIVLNDGSTPGDYVIQVGSTQYPAPSTVGLTGFHVLALDRSDGSKKVDLAVSSLIASPLAPNLLFTIGQHISTTCTGEWGCIVIVSSLQTIGSTNCPNSRYECYFSNPSTDPGYSLYLMGGSDRLNYVNGSNPSNSYSLITTVGQGGGPWRGAGQGNERVACNAGSDCLHDGSAPNIYTGNGDISGALVLDSNNTYTFAYIDRPTFSLPPSKNAGDTNTITVNGKEYGATLPAGASGGFHLLIFDTSALNLSSTYVYENTYATDSQSLGNMVNDLNSFYNNTQNYIAFITSIGDLGHSDAQAEWLQLGATLKQIGGTYDLFSQLDSGDDYSIVANPPAGNTGLGIYYPSRVVEASSIVTRSATTLSDAQNLPSSIRGILSKDRRGYYRPTISNLTSTFGAQTTALLDGVALQPPVAWPLTVSSNLCTDTDSTPQGRGNAYQAISYYLTVTSSTPNGNPDIRSLYPDSEVNTFSSYASDLKTLTAANLKTWLAQYESNQPNLVQFTSDDFCEVQAQVGSELAFVVSVQAYMGQIQSTLTDTSYSLQTEIDIVYDQLAQQLQVDTSSSSSVTADILGGVAGVLSIASYTTPEAPAIALGLDAASVGISYGMSLSNHQSGVPIVADQLRSTLANLKADTQAQYINSSEVIGNMFTLILEDWGRLSTLGLALANNPQPQIQWDTKAQARYINGTYKAMAIEYVKAFFGALGYQIYSWPDLTSGAEPVKNYINVCAYYGVDSDDCTLGQYFDYYDWLNIRSGPDGKQPANGEDGNSWDVYLIAGNVSYSGSQTCDRFGNCSCSQSVGGFYPFDSVMKPIFTPLDPVSEAESEQPNAPQTQNLGVYAPWFFTKTTIPSATLQHDGCRHSTP